MTEMLDKIGQLFVIGFSGPEPSASVLHFIDEENIGGVIVFRDNCPTHDKVRETIDTIKEHSQRSVPFVAVDQEGGRVCRIAGAPAEFTSPAEYAEHLGIERFKEDFSRASVFMESLGINLNLAPVADILLDDNNTCLEGRCFGRSAEDVVPFVRAAVEISKQSGLLSCLKHFPGLGDSSIDPHKATAVAQYDEVVWSQRERLPFIAGVDQGADMIMTTHLRLPNIDKDTVVTGSGKIVTGLLRKRLGFDGPVITDDLTMKGAETLGLIGERAVSAFLAGHDLLLFGQDLEASMEAYEFFRGACARGDIPPERLAEALNRVAGIKFKLGKSVIL